MSALHRLAAADRNRSRSLLTNGNPHEHTGGVRGVSSRRETCSSTQPARTHNGHGTRGEAKRGQGRERKRCTAARRYWRAKPAEPKTTSETKKKPNTQTHVLRENQAGVCGMLLIQSGAREAQCRSLSAWSPPSRCSGSWERAARSVGGQKRLVRSACGSWSVEVDRKLGMNVVDVSVPCPSGAAPVMDPGRVPANPPYPAGRFRLASVHIRNQPGTIWCGEALILLVADILNSH